MGVQGGLCSGEKDSTRTFAGLDVVIVSELGRFVEDEVEGLRLSVDGHSADSEGTGGKGSVDEARG